MLEAGDKTVQTTLDNVSRYQIGLVAAQLDSCGYDKALSVIKYDFNGKTGRHVISNLEGGRIYDFMLKKEFSSIDKLLKYIGADRKNYAKTDVEASLFLTHGGSQAQNILSASEYNLSRWDGDYGETLIRNLGLPQTLGQAEINAINARLSPAGLKLSVSASIATIDRISDGSPVVFYARDRADSIHGKMVSVGTGNYTLNPVDPLVTDYSFGQRISASELDRELGRLASEGFTAKISDDKKRIDISDNSGKTIATYSEEAGYRPKGAYETRYLGWKYSGAPGATQEDLVRIAQAFLGTEASGKLDSSTFAAYLSDSVASGRGAEALPVPKETSFLMDWGYGAGAQPEARSDFFRDATGSVNTIMERIIIEDRANASDFARGIKDAESVLSGYSNSQVLMPRKAEVESSLSWLKANLKTGDLQVADSLATYQAALGIGAEGALTLNEAIKEMRAKETAPITGETLERYLNYNNGDVKPGNERKIVGSQGRQESAVSDAIGIARDYLSKPIGERTRKKAPEAKPPHEEDLTAEPEPGLKVSYKPPAKIDLPSAKKNGIEATYIIMETISDQRKTFEAAFSSLAKEFTGLKAGDFLAGEKFFGALSALAGTRTEYDKMSALYTLMIRQKGELMLAYNDLTWFNGATAVQKKAAAEAMTPARMELKMAELGRCQGRLLATMNKLKGYLVNYGPTLNNLVNRCFDTLLMASLPFAVTGLASFGASLATKQVAFNLTWKAVGVKLARSAVFAAGTTGVSVFSEIRCKNAFDKFTTNQKGAIQELQNNLSALCKRMQNEYQGENKQQIISSINGMISSLEAAKGRLQSASGPSLGSVAVEFLSSTAMFFAIEMLMADYVKVGSKKGKTLFTNSSSSEVSILRDGKVVGTVKPKGILEVQPGDVVQLSANKSYVVEVAKGKPKITRIKEQSTPSVETPVPSPAIPNQGKSSATPTEAPPVKDPVQSARENRADVEPRPMETANPPRDANPASVVTPSNPHAEPQKLPGIGKVDFIDEMPTFTEAQNYARVYSNGGVVKPLDTNRQCILNQGDIVLNYNNTEAYHFNGAIFEPIGKGGLVPLEVRWKYLNNRTTRLLRKQATAVKMDDGCWLVVNTSKKDVFLANEGAKITISPGNSGKAPKGAEIRFGSMDGSANYKISADGTMVQVGVPARAPKPPGFIRRKGEAIVRTYTKVKNSVADTAVAAKKLRTAKAPNPEEARPNWIKRQVEKRARPFKKAYEKVREVSGLIAEFKNAKKIISESKVSGIYDLSAKYPGEMSYYPSHGIVQTSGPMPVAGVKLHIMLPSASETEHYAMADYLISRLLAIKSKFSPGRFGFKYMKGGSTYRMQGSQFGKDFTLYFNDLQSFDEAKPILAELDMILRSIGPKNGKPAVLSENAGLIGSTRLNIDSELPLEGTGFMTYSVRHHSGGTLAVPVENMGAVLQSSGIPQSILENAQRTIHSGKEYFLLSDGFMRNQSKPELNLALEELYRGGMLRYFEKDAMVEIR